MTKFPRTYDSTGRVVIDGEIAYLAHSGKKYFCYGFAKDSATFWERTKGKFLHRMSNGYSFTVEPLRKGQEITDLTFTRVKGATARVVLVD